MVFQRAACLVAGRADASAALLEKERANGAPAFRGLQCLFRRGESPVIDDCSKKQADLNMSVLSTDDVATDLDSSMEGLSTADVFGQESAADGFLATLPVLAEISTFHAQAPRAEEAPTEAPVDEATLFAQRAREAFLARTQRRSTRASLSKAAEEMPRAESEQPLLVRQLAERIRQEAASCQ